MDISDVTNTAYLTPGNLSHRTKQCLLDRYGSVLAMKVVVVVASSLSILGALAIILASYCKGGRKTKNEALHETTGLQNPAQTDDNATDTDVKREERTEKEAVQHPARLIIVCISAADILVAISHIWGVTNNYAHLQRTSIAYYVHGERFQNISIAESTECGAQAVLSIFGTISSFLWSDLLAFMAVVMFAKKRCCKPANFVSYQAFVIYNIICWGIPLIVTCVLGGVNAIGFHVDVGKWSIK